MIGGSSPRLRGTVAIRLHAAIRNRFIPAPAGNGLSTSPRPRSNTVHPRACGERPPSSNPRPSTGGSSPRLRGTAAWTRCLHGYDQRFIPAPAGNGAGSEWLLAYATTRFIPAPAGNGGRQEATRPSRRSTRLRGSSAAAVTVGSSPRLRGTAQPSAVVRPPTAGSSPRLRGTDRGKSTTPRVPSCPRFIPAPAGNG